MAGIIITSLYKRINLLNKVMLLTVGGMSLAVAGIIWGFGQLDKDQMNIVSTTVANILLMTIIVGFIMAGVRKKINVYDAFIEGAKEGFQTAVRIIPYLVAILVGIGVFRASGAMDMIIDGIKWTVGVLGGNTDFVGALPRPYKVRPTRHFISSPYISAAWASDTPDMPWHADFWQTLPE